jgi:hypothetical protein
MRRPKQSTMSCYKLQGGNEFVCIVRSSDEKYESDKTGPRTIPKTAIEERIRFRFIRLV